MDSSRIFVRGLPPSFSEDDFKKHFSIQPVTDVKFMPQRRIGFVGYRTSQEAAYAVKHFNKSFIRMSRIAVELAHPAADTPSTRKKTVNGMVFVSESKSEIISADANPRKRKRITIQDKPKDPKLAEYLDTLNARSEQRTWTEGLRIRTNPSDDPNSNTAEADQGSISDDDYQPVPKRLGRVDIPTSKRDKQLSPEADGNVKFQQGSNAIQDEEVIKSSTASVIQECNSISDMEWLRSRTNQVEQGDGDGNFEQSGKLGVNPGGDDAEQDLDLAGAALGTDEKPKSQSKPKNRSDADTILTTGRLFLRNLSYSITGEDLRDLFSAYGRLNEVHVPVDHQSGSSKGIAYLQFNVPDDAIKAFEALDATILQGRLLHILPSASRRESRLDEYTLSKLPLKKQKHLQKKAEAATSTFRWNSLYMNADAVISSISDRLGVSKADILDPTSSQAAVKQAQAEAHTIQETKAFFVEHGVNLESFKTRERGDLVILIKNLPYGTKAAELKALLEEHGAVTKLLLPPSGMIAIAEFSQALQSRTAFSALSYRKFKGSILFLEKAPKDVFIGGLSPNYKASSSHQTSGVDGPNLPIAELLQNQPLAEFADSSTLFVRNLSFQTTSDRLTETFSPLDGFRSALVKSKPDQKRPGELLSMGFGFLEFSTKAQAQSALLAMQGYNLDGHKLLIKASHKGSDLVEEHKNEDRAKKAAGARTKVIIKNLPFEASKKDLRTLFGTYGQLRSVRLPKKYDNSTRGFAFADFTTPREAENAVNALRDTHLLGRRLAMDFAAEDPIDAEAEIASMQRKVGSQVNKVALENLTSGGRKKFRVSGEQGEEA